MPAFPVAAVTLSLLAVAASSPSADSTESVYREPDPVLVEIIDAPPSPESRLSPDRAWLVLLERESLPEELELTAWTDDGEVMGIRRRGFPEVPVEGIQFHPESILTESGHDLLRTFLAYRPRGRA